MIAAFRVYMMQQMPHEYFVAVQNQTKCLKIFPRIFFSNIAILTKTLEVIMKITDKKKPVNTTPQGVWESSKPVRDKEQNNSLTASTDLQGNGYPVNKQSK